MRLRVTALMFIATLLTGCETFFCEKKGIDAADMFYKGDASAKAGLRATYLLHFMSSHFQSCEIDAEKRGSGVS